MSTSRKDRRSSIIIDLDDAVVYTIYSIIQSNNFEILATYMYNVTGKGLLYTVKPSRVYIIRKKRLIEIELVFEDKRKVKLRVDPSKFIEFILAMCGFGVIEEKICKFCEKALSPST